MSMSSSRLPPPFPGFRRQSLAALGRNRRECFSRSLRWAGSGRVHHVVAFVDITGIWIIGAAAIGHMPSRPTTTTHRTRSR